jgi:hypothetical protein
VATALVDLAVDVPGVLIAERLSTDNGWDWTV